MEMALSFNEIQFDLIDRNHQPWVRGTQIGYALGYQNPRQAIAKLYDSNAGEFTPSMTSMMKLPTEGGEQETRIFSLRGCHLLAMFARTPIAKAFRRWVLDVLDKLAQEESNQPSADASITPDQQCTLQTLVKVKVDAMPEDKRKSAYPQIWSRFNNLFRIARYAQLPQSRMSEAIAYLVKMEIVTAKPALAQRATEDDSNMDPAKYPLMPSNLPKFIQEVETGIRSLSSLCTRLELFCVPTGLTWAQLNHQKPLIDAVCANMHAARAASVASLNMLKSVKLICKGAKQG